MGLICFDLDGTLVDPLRAVQQCAQLTCDTFGLPSPAPEQAAASIGLGARTLFAGLPGMDDPARLERVLEHYWTSFREDGIVRHRIYDGVLLMLTRLKRQGHQLFAVTVQPTRCARQVLHHFDLLLTFEEVFGAGPEAADPGKGDVVARLRERGSLQPGGFLVGDRGEDMEVARANDLVPLGVTYGFGGAAELRAAGARILFDTVGDLDDWFKDKLPEPEILDPFSRSE